MKRERSEKKDGGWSERSNEMWREREGDDKREHCDGWDGMDGMDGWGRIEDRG